MDILKVGRLINVKKLGLEDCDPKRSKVTTDSDHYDR